MKIVYIDKKEIRIKTKNNHTIRLCIEETPFSCLYDFTNPENHEEIVDLFRDIHKELKSKLYEFCHPIEYFPLENITIRSNVVSNEDFIYLNLNPEIICFEVFNAHKDEIQLKPNMSLDDDLLKMALMEYIGWKKIKN